MTGCRQYGFFSYMKDLFQCPDSVMAYLCVLYNVHKIPVGDDSARRHVERVIRSHPEVRQFYTANVHVRTVMRFLFVSFVVLFLKEWPV